MIEKVRRYIERERLLDKTKRYLVAVSGGADSVCLLLMLKEMGYDVEVAHCNFNLRGEESRRDEMFVLELCKKHGIELHLIHFDTKIYASLHHVSIEMAARDLRYRYFEQLRQDLGFDGICVAHHLDDSVETMLMNLLRGTGVHGLSGIKPRNGYILRPLLTVSRTEIEDWLREQGQDYVTDSTNLVADIVRNKLRLQAIPALTDCSPLAKDAIMVTARRMGEVAKVYDHAIRQSLGRLVVDDSLDIDALMQEPSPESLLYEWLTPAGFSPATIENIFEALSQDAETSGREWHSTTHWLVTHRGKSLTSNTQHPTPNTLLLAPQEPERPILRMPEPGTYVYDNHTKLRISLLEGAIINKETNVCCLDAKKVAFPLTLRPAKQGDRFHPLGMKGSKLVSDYLTDRHLSLIEKRRQIVLCDAKENIVWLAGQRPDERFKVDETTKETLTVMLF